MGAQPERGIGHGANIHDSPPDARQRREATQRVRLDRKRIASVSRSPSPSTRTGKRTRITWSERRMSGSDSGSEGGGGGGGRGGGDLASRTVVLESKRFYLDVKENSRGRFIKIAELSADGRKNQILMTLPTASQFRQHLVSFIDTFHTLDPVDPKHLHQGELRSEVMFKEDKKYHIDLKVCIKRFFDIGTFNRSCRRPDRQDRQSAKSDTSINKMCLLPTWQRKEAQ